MLPSGQSGSYNVTILRLFIRFASNVSASNVSGKKINCDCDQMFLTDGVHFRSGKHITLISPYHQKAAEFILVK